MAETVLLPKSGISVEKCIIGAWHKKIGDAVKIGDVLFEYETDKAVFECESTAEGELLAILFDAGDEVEVLEPVCVIGFAGEDISAFSVAEAAASDTTSGGTITHDNNDSTCTDKQAAPKVLPAYADSPTSDPEKTGTGISPRAKNLIGRLGVDASNAVPTGPGDRIITRDIDIAYQSSFSDTAETDPQAVGATDYTDEPMPKIRRVIAENMLASLRSGAQLTHHHSFDASALLQLREVYKNSDDEELRGISVGDMIVYAVSRTLTLFPYMNALLLDDNILRTYSAVHLGVAIDTPRGLMVPTVFNADKKTLKEISDEIKQLAARARSGRISPDLLQGGTFTVSNLGPTGVEMFTPILNAPQVGILGVCGVTDKVRAKDNTALVYPSIGLSLTYDHRAVDGAPASRFAQALAQSLEIFQSDEADQSRK